MFSIRWMVAQAAIVSVLMLSCGVRPREMICQEGYTLCGFNCVELPSNPRNCGACGNACGQGQACQDGACNDSCPSGYSMCGGECVKLKTDDLHCGACGKACGQGQACQDSACIDSCPSGYSMCGGECVKLETDDLHCGACGVACGEGKSCSDGTCVGACPAGQKYCAGRCVSTSEAECGCVANLLSATPDSWGAMWDGQERKAASLEAAKKSCEAVGGRLPTATELYRVSANQSGEVGQSYTINPLWSLVPADPANQIAVTLHNGTAASTLMTSEARYRCICPAATPAYFAGRACHGAPGKECFNIPTGGKAGRYNIDSSDRAALPKGAALWECGFYRAHLPEFATLVAAIREGLPNGSKTGLYIADEMQGGVSALIAWSGTALNWDVKSVGNVTGGGFVEMRPFRCVGINYSPTTTIPDVVKEQKWLDSRTGLIGDVADSGHYQEVKPEDAHVNAHDTCWRRGGHLARTAELASLVNGGLPGGSGNWLQTADRVGDGRSTLARWTAERMFDYRYEPYGVSWSSRGDAAKRPFRCVYYPVDEQSVEPAACSGGCIRLVLPKSRVVIWLDGKNRNRAPLASAIHDCEREGGQLPLVRDYVEAIRNGLPAGAGEVMTSDLTLNQNPLYHAINWNGTEGDKFNSQDIGRSNPVDVATENPYRCMWTNELR